MGGLLHLLQRGGDWAGWVSAQSPPRCTKSNSPPIKGQCSNFILFDVALWLPLHSNGLRSYLAVAITVWLQQSQLVQCCVFLLKLHLFDLLWICCTTCCTTNPQQIESCTTFCSNSTYSICCGFVVQLVVQQIHNKSTTLRQVVQQAVRQIHNKSNKWSLSFTALRILLGYLTW